MFKMDLRNRLKNFPHIHYVNLDNRTDRREYMEEQFNYWKLPFTRISGSKFLASTIEDWVSDYVVGTVKGIPAYAIGNAVTHLEFMKNWIQSSDDDYLLLMEDDYDLTLFEFWNFDWNYLMSRLPYDWDCLQIGFESSEFIPFFLHPKLRHSYFGPVILQRDYVEKILHLHCYKDKYRFDHTTAIRGFSGNATTVDYFVGHTGKTYCIPLITTNVKLPSTEFSLDINRKHHENSRHAYYYWWMAKHLKFSLDDFFTFGKRNDHKMVILTA